MQRANHFIAPCLPTLRKEPPTSPGWLHEVKFDGYRIQLHKDGDHVTLFSRNGNDLTSRYPTIVEAVTQLPTKAVVLDAELTACSDDGRPDFSALLRKRHTHLCVWVFNTTAFPFHCAPSVDNNRLSLTALVVL